VRLKTQESFNEISLLKTSFKVLKGLFFFSIKLKNCIDCYIDAVSVLSVCNIKSVLAALKISEHEMRLEIMGLTFISHKRKKK